MSVNLTAPFLLIKYAMPYLKKHNGSIVNVGSERLGKDQNYLLDSAKLRNEFNWKEEFNLEDGLFETIEWVRINLKILSDLPWSYQHKSRKYLSLAGMVLKALFFFHFYLKMVISSLILILSGLVAICKNIKI